MNDLTKIEETRNDLTVSQASEIFLKSGFFKDVHSREQAVTKILAGREHGFGAFTSMSKIHIIQGKIELSAELLATAIKRSDRYNYRVVKWNNDVCTLDFYECSPLTANKWVKVGDSSFSMQDAKTAGLGGNAWNKYPRNMLYARALSNGQAIFCPDVVGSRVYTEGEISGELTEPVAQIEGDVPDNIIEGTVVQPPPEVPQSEPNQKNSVEFDKVRKGLERATTLEELDEQIVKCKVFLNENCATDKYRERAISFMYDCGQTIRERLEGDKTKQASAEAELKNAFDEPAF